MKSSCCLSSVCLLLALIGLSSCTAQSVSGLDRFLVSPRTVTSTVTATTTVTSTLATSTSCASVAAGVTACRRRRAAMEEPMAIQPAAPLPIEVSAAPRARQYGGYYNNNPAPAAPVPAAAEDSARSADAVPVLDSSISSNTDGMAEVQIRNLDSVCQARAANPFFGVGLGSLFGITVLFSTTTTSTSTVTSTVTSFSTTKTFSIVGCTPTPFSFKTC